MNTTKFELVNSHPAKPDEKPEANPEADREIKQGHLIILIVLMLLMTLIFLITYGWIFHFTATALSGPQH